MKKFPLLFAILLAGCAKLPQTASSTDADAVFQRLADDYIAGYLAWRPQSGTSLGLHQYDGKLTDYSAASIKAELARLKSFDRKLAGLDTASLSRRAYYDYRILRNNNLRE